MVAKGETIKGERAAHPAEGREGGVRMQVHFFAWPCFSTSSIP